MERAPTEPKPRSALAVAAGSLLLFAFLGQLAPALALRVRSEAELAARLHLLLVFSPFAGLTCIWIAHRLGRLPPAPRAPLASPVASLATALVAGALALLGSIAISVLQIRLGVRLTEQAVVVDAFRATPHPWLLRLGIVLLVPIGEELVFRRLGFAAILARHGRLAAYGWSTAVFAVIHLHPPGFPSYAWIGLVTAIAYDRTGRIEVPIAAHAINNAVAALSL